MRRVGERQRRLADDLGRGLRTETHLRVAVGRHDGKLLDDVQRAHVGRRRDLLEAEHPSLRRPAACRLRYPVLRRRQPSGVGVLRGRRRLRLRWPMEVVGVDDDAGGPVVERLHHLPFVQRQPAARRAVEAVAVDRPGPFLLLQLVAAAKTVRVVCHVEHGLVAKRPGGCRSCRITRPVHQHRQAPVDRHRQRGVTARAEDRGRARIRIHAREIARRQLETALGIREFRNVAQVERTIRRSRCGSASGDEDTELERRVLIREEHSPVLEVVQHPQPTLRRHAPEETRRRLVGGDARRHDQSYQAVRPDQRQRPLNEQRVEVDVAAGQQRVDAASAGDAGGGLGALRRVAVLVRQRVAGLLQGRDHPPAVGRARLPRDLRTPSGEPLDLLQLHAVPGRIADHGVEAATPRGGVPVGPHAGERGLPVEEALFGRDRARIVEETDEAFVEGRGAGHDGLPGRDAHRVAEPALQELP